MKTGFEKFLECLDLYLELLNNPTIDEARIRIYGSVTLSNGAIVRATSNFHNREWFSEVAISMSSEESDDYTSDQGVCYGQVIYMFKVIYWSKFILLIHLTDHSDVHKVSLITKITEFPPF
jgi:hypothetical protein